MYNMSLVHLRIKPGQTCQHMHTGNPTKPLIKMAQDCFLNVSHMLIVSLTSFLTFNLTLLLLDNPCLAFPCQHDGTCRNTGINTFTCTCQPGSTGSNCASGNALNKCLHFAIIITAMSLFFTMIFQIMV